MTNKELIRLAGNEDAFYLLGEIKNELQNLCHKTAYEQRTTKHKLRAYASMIRAILEEEEEKDS